jgi:hypothetical protein
MSIWPESVTVLYEFGGSAMAANVRDQFARLVTFCLTLYRLIVDAKIKTEIIQLTIAEMLYQHLAQTR